MLGVEQSTDADALDVDMDAADDSSDAAQAGRNAMQASSVNLTARRPAAKIAAGLQSVHFTTTDPLRC